MSYLEYAYPKGKPFDPVKLNVPLLEATQTKIGGRHYYTWRNIIAREALADKEDKYNVENNPELIPGTITNRYQDHNFIQVIQPLQTFWPATLSGRLKQVTSKKGKNGTYMDPVPGGIKGLVRSAWEKGLKVKAVGTGHSFSDIMTTPDFLVVTDDLNEILTHVLPGKETESGIPKTLNIRHYPYLNATIKDPEEGYAFFAGHIGDPDYEKAGLVEFEAGIKIRDLNDKLWDRGWSLTNMGTYQGQSFIGAASTSTHGSGNNLPPLPDMIKSIVIVADEGVSFRIEPNNGITEAGNKGPVKPRYFPKELVQSAGLADSIFLTDEKDVDFLIQNDDCFNATLVNVGTFGIVYSVIIEVVPKFYLLETVEFTTWKDLKKRLQSQSQELFEKKPYTAKLRRFSEFLTSFILDDDQRPDLYKEDIRQVSILFNANKYQDENFCRITRQYYVEEEIGNKWVNQNNKGRGLPGYAKDIARGTIDKLGEVLKYSETEQNTEYERKQKDILKVIFQPVSGDPIATGVVNVDGIVRQIKQNGPIEPTAHQYYLNRAYRVYVKPSDLPGYGMETGFSMEKEYGLQLPGKPTGDPAKAYITAVDHIIEMAAEHWREGRYIQTANSAIRFVKGSQAYLSPQHGELTCMIEVLNVADTHGGKELFYRYQREFFKYGGRPHWGLDLSVTTGNNELMKKMYKKFPEWKKIYDLLNFHGTFNNRFTDRMGLSVQDFPQDEIGQ